MRVLYVQPAISAGGAERQASLLADALRRAGLAPLVVSGPGFVLDGWLEALRLEHRHSGAFAGPDGWRPRRWPASLARLASLLDTLDALHAEHAFDAVIGSLGEGWAAAGLFGRRHGVPVLWRAGGITLGRTSRRLSPVGLGTALLAQALRPSRIVCNAAAVARYWSRMTRAPVSIVPNVVSPGVVRLRRVVWAPRHVGYLGRLAPEKGLEPLVEAFAAVAPEFPATRLLIGGPGDAAPLLALAQRLGVGPRVRCVGLVDDVDAFLDALDLLVLPSRTEGSPNVLLEAFAHAVPVLATAVGGTVELVEDGVDGWLVAPDDTRALALGLKRALSSPERGAAMARDAVRRLAPHSPDTVAAAWTTLLRSAAAKRPQESREGRTRLSLVR